MTNPMVSNKSNIKIAKKDKKTAFITILCTLAAIDGNIKPEEIDYIKDLATEINVKVYPTFFTTSTEECLLLASQIKQRRLALELLKNMFALAYTDNTFSDSESLFISAISEALNIEPQKVNEISSWMVERIIWLERGALIFEDTPNT